MIKSIIFTFVGLTLAAIGIACFRAPPSLREAVKAGDAAQVAEALQSGADPNVRN